MAAENFQINMNRVIHSLNINRSLYMNLIRSLYFRIFPYFFVTRMWFRWTLYRRSEFDTRICGYSGSEKV